MVKIPQSKPRAKPFLSALRRRAHVSFSTILNFLRQTSQLCARHIRRFPTNQLLAKCPSPVGATDNSPRFQPWVECTTRQVLKGRLKCVAHREMKKIFIQLSADLKLETENLEPGATRACALIRRKPTKASFPKRQRRFIIQPGGCGEGATPGSVPECPQP